MAGTVFIRSGVTWSAPTWLYNDLMEWIAEDLADWRQTVLDARSGGEGIGHLDLTGDPVALRRFKDEVERMLVRLEREGGAGWQDPGAFPKAIEQIANLLKLLDQSS